MMLCHKKACHQVLFWLFAFRMKKKWRLSLESDFNAPSRQVVLIRPHCWDGFIRLLLPLGLNPNVYCSMLETNKTPPFLLTWSCYHAVAFLSYFIRDLSYVVTSATKVTRVTLSILCCSCASSPGCNHDLTNATMHSTTFTLHTFFYAKALQE